MRGCSGHWCKECDEEVHKLFPNHQRTDISLTSPNHSTKQAEEAKVEDEEAKVRIEKTKYEIRKAEAEAKEAEAKARKAEYEEAQAQAESEVKKAKAKAEEAKIWIEVGGFILKVAASGVADALLSLGVNWLKKSIFSETAEEPKEDKDSKPSK